MEEQAQKGANEDAELSARVWWNHKAYGVVRGGGNEPRGQVFDDDYLIRNVRPLALIVQYLPTMAYSVQVGHTPTCLPCFVCYRGVGYVWLLV